MNLSEDKRNLVDKYKGKSIEQISQNMRDQAFPLHLAIENYQHDFNIGSIVRNANAFNVAGVHIIGKRHWNRKGAMMTETYLQMYHHDSVKSFYDWSQKNSIDCIGVDNIERSQFLSGVALPSSAVYVFGQEGPGLSKEMIKICKKLIAIEQFGSTRSINVGVASGIILYAWVNQHVLKKIKAPKRLQLYK